MDVHCLRASLGDYKRLDTYSRERFEGSSSYNNVYIKVRMHIYVRCMCSKCFRLNAVENCVRRISQCKEHREGTLLEMGACMCLYRQDK